MAAVEAAAGGRGEGQTSPRPQPPPPKEPTAADGEPLQLLDNVNEVSHLERPHVLATSWRAATDPLAPIRLLQNLHRITLIHILQEGWKTCEESNRKELLDSIRNCAEAVKSKSEYSTLENRLSYLIKLADDPWHPTVLKNIMQGIQPDSQQVILWLRDEGSFGALERLRQLCTAGGQCEKAAVRLATAMITVPPEASVLPPQFKNRALESLLVLLFRAHRTTECITHIKAMETSDAINLVGKLATKNKSNGRIWKHARDTALLCTQVLVATSLVKPLESAQLGTLATRLASLYASRTDEFAPALRKLLNSADTAGHIYTVCRAIQSEFGETMRPFICELYIRALTTGVNELERLKLQDEAGENSTKSSHQLAEWFISLADFLAANTIVSAECVLTAFSLHPSKQYYQQVQESAKLLKDCKPITKKLPTSQLPPITSTPISQPPPPGAVKNLNNIGEDPFKNAIDGLETHLHELQLLKNSSGSESTDAEAEPPQSLLSSAILESEGLGLSSDLCHDLAVLLSGPRLKMLTWDLSWDKLSEHCLSYMADTEEGTKTVTKELKYVHLDYSQFEIKTPEVHDIYFGIEKGYEHHLELEDDSDEDEEIEQVYKLASDNSDLDEMKTVFKKSKKKSSKKDVDLDYESSFRTPMRKDKVKKERSKEKKKKSRKLATSSTESDGISDELKEKYGFMRKYPNDLEAVANIAPVNRFSHIQTPTIKQEMCYQQMGVNISDAKPVIQCNSSQPRTYDSYASYPSSAIRYNYKNVDQWNRPIVTSAAGAVTTTSTSNYGVQMPGEVKKQKSSLLSFRKPNFNANNPKPQVQSASYSTGAVNQMTYHNPYSNNNQLNIKQEQSATLQALLKHPVKPIQITPLNNYTSTSTSNLYQNYNYPMNMNNQSCINATITTTTTTNYYDQTHDYSKIYHQSSMSDTNIKKDTLNDLHALRNKLISLEGSDSNKFRRKPTENYQYSYNNQYSVNSQPQYSQNYNNSYLQQQYNTNTVSVTQTTANYKMKSEYPVYHNYASNALPKNRNPVSMGVQTVPSEFSNDNLTFNNNSNSITQGCSSIKKEISVENNKQINVNIPSKVYEFEDMNNLISAFNLDPEIVEIKVVANPNADVNKVIEKVNKSDNTIPMSDPSQLSKPTSVIQRVDSMSAIKKQLQTICQSKIANSQQQPKIDVIEQNVGVSKSNSEKKGIIILNKNLNQTKFSNFSHQGVTITNCQKPKIDVSTSSLLEQNKNIPKLIDCKIEIKPMSENKVVVNVPKNISQVKFENLSNQGVSLTNIQKPNVKAITPISELKVDASVKVSSENKIIINKYKNIGPVNIEKLSNQGVTLINIQKPNVKSISELNVGTNVNVENRPKIENKINKSTNVCHVKVAKLSNQGFTVANIQPLASPALEQNVDANINIHKSIDSKVENKTKSETNIAVIKPENLSKINIEKLANQGVTLINKQQVKTDVITSLIAEKNVDINVNAVKSIDLDKIKSMSERKNVIIQFKKDVCPSDKKIDMSPNINQNVNINVPKIINLEKVDNKTQSVVNKPKVIQTGQVLKKYDKVVSVRIIPTIKSDTNVLPISKPVICDKNKEKQVHIKIANSKDIKIKPKMSTAHIPIQKAVLQQENVYLEIVDKKPKPLKVYQSKITKKSNESSNSKIISEIKVCPAIENVPKSEAAEKTLKILKPLNMFPKMQTIDYKGTNESGEEPQKCVQINKHIILTENVMDNGLEILKKCDTIAKEVIKQSIKNDVVVINDQIEVTKVESDVYVRLDENIDDEVEKIDLVNTEDKQKETVINNTTDSIVSEIQKTIDEPELNSKVIDITHSIKVSLTPIEEIYTNIKDGKLLINENNVVPSPDDSINKELNSQESQKESKISEIKQVQSQNEEDKAVVEINNEIVLESKEDTEDKSLSKEVSQEKKEEIKEVIELSDSESDVELVSSNDPIAIDTNPLNLSEDSDDKSVMKYVKAPPMPPVFLTLVSTPKSQPNVKKYGKRKYNKLQGRNSQPQNEPLYIVNEGSSKMIKISNVPLADKKKLQMSCSVKLEKCSQIKNDNKDFGDLEVKNKYRGRIKGSKNKKKCIVLSNRTLRSGPIKKNFRRCNKYNIKFNKVVAVNLVRTDTEKFDINKVKVEKGEIETREEDKNESIKENEPNNHINIMANNEEDEKEQTLDKTILENYATKQCQPDILPDINLVNDNSETTVCNATIVTQNVSVSLKSPKSPCPDLINKTESTISFQQPDIIPNCNRNNDITPIDSEDEDYLSCEIFQKNQIKTYENKFLHKNKRKTEFKVDNEIVKKVKNDISIDLPQLSQVDIISVSHKDTVINKQNYNENVPFSLKQLLSKELDQVNSVDKKITREYEMETMISLDQKYNIIDFLSETESRRYNNTEQFCSPIFSDCEDVNCDLSKGNDENKKYSWQGKGFCDWSGRGNMKDSSRGRQEGPAAVLSDANITRPPLALHNFVNSKPNDSFAPVYISQNKKESEKEMNNNLLKNFNKNGIKSSYLYSNENIFNSEKLTNEIKSILGSYKNKDNHLKENLKCFGNSMPGKKSIFSKVPGLDNLDFMRPLQSMNIVNVVQLGQLPVTSSQQSSLSNTLTNSQSTPNEFLDITSNNAGDYRSSNENSQQSSSNDNNTGSYNENNIADEDKVSESNKEKKSDEDATQRDHPDKITSNENHFNNTDTNSVNEGLDKQPQQDFQQSTSQKFSEDQNEQKEESTSESVSENQINIMTSTSTAANIVSANRSLVNLLSQKLVQNPGSVQNQHVQMATFPKGTTINALSLQQALAQILPPPLSQSGDSVIHNTTHSTVSPQVVHIVQGKNSNQSGNTFGSLLVDNSQQGVMNTTGGTQVLHIVQGKSSATSNNSNILNQSQIAGTTFSGLSLVDASGQQSSGQQILQIVNAGMQAKNNNAVIKRVNLLTSITNPQGNNEQKMVQLFCKSADGKSIQLNTQHQRGMVLRLQPIDNSSFNQNQKTSEAQQTSSTSSNIQTTVKAQEQSQQELKSRSVYEENYAKFIQNSANPIVPSSPEKSVTLPKFNQAFGKSVYQENSTITKSNENLEQITPVVSTANEQQQNSQDLTTLNLGQLSHIGSPPLLIRKAPSSNIVHQNVVQQVKPSIAPMNIQTIHGGVIYTRQIPVNIGGGQTINLITVPSSDIIDDAQKQNQEKNNSGEQIEPQVIKLVSQDQSQSNSNVIETSCDDTNQSFTEQQSQNNVNTHPLLTQMRIKVPVLSKGGSQMVTGTRVVRPVLQIQRNIIPGTNPAVYQQLVLTTAPSIRQPVPTPVTNVRPARPAVTTHQESNLSSSTLEQLREFDMVLEQVKERSTTTQPNSNSSSTFSDNSPQVVDNNSDIDNQTTINQTPAQREVLYSIGPNQTVNVTYVNQKVISKTPSILTTSYGSSDTVVNISSQNSPSNQITHGLTNTTSHTKPGPNTPTKINSKSIKTKPSKPANPSTSNASKSSPVAAKTSLQKPLEDEQTTQRILYILAEYKEQVENSPDKDKPAPRRRSNPPTNPTTTSKRKKGSGSTSKKGGSGQSIQEMSPLGGEDAGHTMGSEDSSCGLSQGECTDNSIQGTDNQSPQSSPQKSAKKLLFQPESETPTPPISQPQQQQRNVIIADGQTIAMARPGTGKATAVLMPANYLLPMSMVKGSQQITIVTNQGPKILSVPQGEGGAANTLFVQRLISPAGLKPMLARPGQVRHVRLPANAVQNLQAFNINASANITSQDDQNPDSVKSEVSDTPSIKDETMSIGSEHMPTIKTEDTGETSAETGITIKREDIILDQSQVQDATMQSMPDHILQAIKSSPGNTLNLIQVHSLSGDCSRLYSVQNTSNVGSLIQLSNKNVLHQAHQGQSIHALNEDNSDIGMQESATNLLVRKHLQFDAQFLNSKLGEGDGGQAKLSDVANHLESMSTSTQQAFIMHSNQGDGDLILKTENHNPWSTNGNGPGSDPSSSFVNFEDSPHRLTHRDDHQDVNLQESDGTRELIDSGVNRVLRHPYSPSSSPPGPRHLYHKMFISTPVKKTFASEIDHSTSSIDDDKQFVQQRQKKIAKVTTPTSAVILHKNNSSFTIHHRHNPQVISIRHADDKSGVGESMDVSTASVSGGRSGMGQNSSSHHSAASLRHKYAVMEHELRLQKSLSEECEDLGVDSPSASDLFPEAELLFAASPSSQFDQSQDGCVLAPASHSSPSIHLSSAHQMSSGSNNLNRDSKLLDTQPIEGAEESEFARMHPNTTFHSGEIELVGDDADEAIFRTATNKMTSSSSHMKRVDIVRSVIEGIGNNSSSATFASIKLPTHFTMGDLSRQTINVMSSVQSSDDLSEGADDSMNSAESKDILVNNKCLDGLLTNEIIKRDLNLSSAESSICISSGIIQRNVTQVIRHAGSDQLLDSSEKLCSTTVGDLNENGRNFLLEAGSDIRPAADSSILKSIMLERDGRDGLTCSSPDQHSELFWESNSNSNQSEEQTSQAPPNLLDFSSEDSNKCCKSPLSCEESNSTDSSSLGDHNTQTHNSHPLRLNSVIKTSAANNSTAAEGPILHNALLGASNQDKKQLLQQHHQQQPIILNSIHKSDSSSSHEDDHSLNRRSWNRSHKGNRRVLSPQSLTTEINLGAEIETSSSEGVNIITKTQGGTLMHSGSSTPEEGSSNNRRVSLRGPGGVKRSCHCCSGTPAVPAPAANTNTNTRRARRKPPQIN